MTVAEGSSTNVTRYEFEAHASAARSARSSDGDGTACTRRSEVQIEMSPLCIGVGEIEREPERRWAGRFEPPTTAYSGLSRERAHLERILQKGCARGRISLLANA
jgi:hypothetical protein